MQIQIVATEYWGSKLLFSFRHNFTKY